MMSKDFESFRPKPIIDIYDAYLMRKPLSINDQVLIGHFYNSKIMIHSFTVIKVDGNIVETRNVVYNVKSWDKSKDERQLELEV